MLQPLHFGEIFGHAETYQLPPESGNNEDEEFSPQHLRGRFLFGQGMNYTYLNGQFAAGAVIKTTKLTEKFDYEAFQKLYRNTAKPLFLINEDKELMVFTVEDQPTPKPGHTIISLVDPVVESQGWD